MQVGVVGVGIQGGVCASILVKEPSVRKLILIDINGEKLKACRKKLNSEKIQIFITNANAVDDIANVLKGCDLCFDMLLPEYATNIMKAALKVNAHYINTAYDFPFWANIINKEPLYLDKQFRDKGLTALLGCGDSPGLVNIYVKKYCDKLDKIYSVKIYGAYKNKLDDFLHKWNPGWSVKQAYIDFITPPYIFRNGKFIMMEPFAEVEQKEFINYGIRRFALHSHEENYSIPYVIKKGIQECEFKYEIDPYAAVFYFCGFTKDKAQKIDDKNIDVIDFLLSVISDNSCGTNFAEDDLLDNNEYSTLIYINGKDSSGNKNYVIVLPPLNSNKDYVWKKFGTLKIDVALPAIIGMKCLPDASKGIIFAEDLDPSKFIQILNQYVEYNEVVLKGM